MKEPKMAKPLEWKEVRKTLLFLEGVEAYHHLLIVAVGFFTGFRITDILDLKYSDFDGAFLDIAKRKTTRQRKVKIAPELRRIVILCQARLKRKNKHHLFVRERFFSDKPITKSAANTRIRQAFEYVNIQDIQLPGQTLRKTFALRYFNLYRKEKGDFWAVNEISLLLNHPHTDATCQFLGLEKPIQSQHIFDNFF